MILNELYKKRLIHCPDWLPSNTHYATIMGSVAYGVSSDTSDMDIYGWCIPPKDVVFPHLAGEIFGFGRQVKRFDQYQEHAVKLRPHNIPQGVSYNDIINELERRKSM